MYIYIYIYIITMHAILTEHFQYFSMGVYILPQYNRIYTMYSILTPLLHYTTHEPTIL